MKLLLLLTGFFLISILTACAKPWQAHKLPEEGRECPDFTLQNIKYYSLKQARLADFKGKWLVLDFWSKGCGSCVESFPKTNAMQKEFADKVQFMLVGYQDREGKIEPMYDRFHEREHLVLPCGFDSAFANQWCIWNCPHIVIVDPSGIVQGITNEIKREEIATFLQGGHPILNLTYHSQCRDFDDPRDSRTIPFDDKKPFLVNDNGGYDSDFLFRSLLSKWDKNTQRQYAPSLIDWRPGFPAGTFQVIGVPLEQLYHYAYFGRYSWGCDDTIWYGKYDPHVLVEAGDSAVFHFSYDTPTKNLFNYSLVMPSAGANKARMQQIMQRDLKNYFGYEVSIETRTFPCWKLVATEEGRRKLRTAGGETNQTIEIIPRAEYRFLNAPVRRLITALGGFGDVILDETGIDGNIDITIENVTKDDLLNSLHRNGLSLEPTEKQMRVLVIRDAKEPEVSAMP